MQITQNYTIENDGYKKNGALIPKGIMIHSTATPGIMAAAFRERFNKPNLGKSVHAFVDDKECIQCLPWNKKAGHCLLSGNSTHIGIEMCEPKNWTTDKDYFAKVYANAADVAVQLCQKFGLPEGAILSHAEGYKKGIASNHADVGHWFPYFGKTMDDFRADVKAALNATAAVSTPDSKASVRELQAVLNSAFGCGLAVDGLPGPKTQAEIKDNMPRFSVPNVKNDYVKWIQQTLIAKGYSCGAAGADGIFGRNTFKAVQTFQKANDLAPDGLPGIKTITALLK